MWVCAAGVKLGCAVSESLSGCAGSRICDCGAPCVRAGVAVGRPVQGPVEFVWSVCAAVSAAGAAAVRRKAGGEAVTRVPVRPRGSEWVASASVNRSARARGIVARMHEKVGRNSLN